MSAAPAVEHYVTLFDNNFLPHGLCLHASLQRHGGAHVLWIVCMDDTVERHLKRLALPNVRLIALTEAETKQLRRVKADRTRAEYCWTVTPFAPDFVFSLDPSAQRVTYLDADLFFFASPQPLFAELEASGKDVLITEHAYAPEYENTALSGRFCVQFVTFGRTERAAEVLKWWQARCIEWCYARCEDGKYGDQKYLDQWPQLFGDRVHIFSDPDLTLAPWNSDYRIRRGLKHERPAFYHFHGLRVVTPQRVKLFSGHRISASRFLYDEYLAAMRDSAVRLRMTGIEVPALREPAGVVTWLRKVKYLYSGIVAYARI